MSILKLPPPKVLKRSRGAHERVAARATLRLALLGALLAWGVPWLAMRRANFGVLREGHGGHPELALTFEGGPDDMTARVLDVLAEKGAKATFLFDPARAVARPELVRRAVGEGHEVGGSGSLGLRRGRAGLATLGATVAVWRPTVYDATTAWRLERANVRAVGWSLRGTPKAVEDRLEPGNIVALTSDDGLGEWLDSVGDRGYTFVTVSHLQGARTEATRGLLVRMWRRVVDERFDRAGHLDLLTRRARGLTRLGLAPYEGPPLTLPNGDVVQPGEPAAEIHVHSKRLVTLVDVGTFVALRAFRDSLRDVAEQLQTNPKYEEVRLVFAFSLFHEVLEPLGFQSARLESETKERVLSMGMNALRRLYGTRTDRRVLRPRISWVDREAFLRKYGAKAKRRDETV
ncbi:polysaccharide deacetylase family protein [Deinococcus yavapaiensis]|uniref:polysaccharide deacetylase family protein n=1 Tax=Deinococcus yavapaiensis TaxID=309889 RepID=UPI001B860A9E|nr:polysaccharide deacetylase family protein [Deinococcus yavapaiensis]